jgi:hypothetical protein
LDRRKLVAQIAKAFAGEAPGSSRSDDEDLRRKADEALARVEVYLGVEIEEAKEIVSKVIEDVP